MKRISKLLLVSLLGVGSVVGLAACSTSGQGDLSTQPSGESDYSAQPGSENPQAATGDAANSEATMASSNTGTVLEVAEEQGSFNTLTQAIEAADLEATLNGEGPYTVFAPTDEAFAALPEGTVEELLKPENKAALTQLLTYHVIPGEVTSAQLSSGDVQTVEGTPVTIQADGAAVRVNEAQVVQPDVLASNGVIHVVDQVILPSDIQSQVEGGASEQPAPAAN